MNVSTAIRYLCNMTDEILSTYGNRLRVRVCGVCIENDKILLIKHKSITKSGVFYAPPGGGINPKESAIEALKREFSEETGLEIAVNRLLFVNDYVKPPLHGVELFFEVSRLSGELQLGIDPETQNQIIESLNWLNISEVKALKSEEKHSFLDLIKSFDEIYTLDKYLTQL